MLQGSGRADRDSGGYFPPIRDAFLGRGIAVYSFDKPGVGGSSGNWRNFGLFDVASQARAAVATVKEHPAIDAARVGVWGHSQGAWVVQIVAAQADDLAFAIANSGPSIPPREQDLYGVEHTLRAQGQPTDHIAKAVALMNALHAAAMRGDDYATVSRELLQPAKDQPWSGYLSLEEPEDWDLVCRFVAEEYLPPEALRQIRCPFLAIFGELDVLLPAHQSAVECGQALREAGNLDATIVTFPHGNHRLLRPEGGEFVPGYLDLLADWTASRVKRS
jgi:pimeloyl-ACP methyl ester carboxylesterase